MKNFLKAFWFLAVPALLLSAELHAKEPAAAPATEDAFEEDLEGVEGLDALEEGDELAGEEYWWDAWQEDMGEIQEEAVPAEKSIEAKTTEAKNLIAKKE